MEHSDFRFFQLEKNPIYFDKALHKALQKGSLILLKIGSDGVQTI